MTRNISFKYIRIFVFVLIATFSFSCGEKSFEGMIVFTQAPQIETKTEFVLDSYLKIKGSHILAINPNQTEEEVLDLTKDFYSAVSPEISYDGKYMLFSAQKELNETWQIWEMNLTNLKARQITFFEENCVSPAYLPGERFVFSRELNNEKVKTAFTLFTGNLDGTDFRQITFNPNTYLASNVLNDGRIITVSRKVYPENGNDKLMVLRPDGTKLELFCEQEPNCEILGKAKETEDGKIVFIESNKGIGNVVSVDYNRPLKGNTNLTSDIKGNFHFITPLQSGEFVVTHRKEGKSNFGLYKLSQESKQLSLLFEKEGFSVNSAAEVVLRERPRNLPSEVNMGVKTGLLMCQDINFYGIESLNNQNQTKAEKIEIVGVDSLLGVVDVEADGSFYIKILADTPFRLQTITNEGELVKGPGTWMYLRPNERRGCVGCHSGNEISPFNRQPLSVKKDPVFIPKEIEGISEFKVELE